MLNEILTLYMLSPFLIGMIVGLCISRKSLQYCIRTIQIGAAFTITSKGLIQMKVSLAFALIPVALGCFIMGIGISLLFKHSLYSKEQAKLEVLTNNSATLKNSKTTSENLTDKSKKNRHISVLNKYNS